MKEDDDFLDNFLMHHDLTHARAANYDKEKVSQYNREYYLRNRQLKGRKGAANLPGQKAASGKEATTQKNQPNQQQQELQKRIARLRTRLKSLKTQLSEVLAKAKEKKEKAAKTKTTSKKDETQTTAEKQKAARESRKYRETHKSELKAKQEKAKKEKEKSPKKLDDMTESEIRAEIKSVQRKLNEAIARARSMAK